MSSIKPRDARLLTDLREGIVDRYLATAEQVIAAGFERSLAPRLRKP